MLRVRKEDLRLGMYIQGLEGSWFDHPFWKSKFLLTEEEDLRKLQDSEIDVVLVDAARSLAPALAHLSAPEPAPRSKLLEEFAAKSPSPRPRAGKAAGAKDLTADPWRRPAPRPNEFHAARMVLTDCMAAVGELFVHVEKGGDRAIEEATPVVNAIAESVERHPDALVTLTRVRSLDQYTYMHSIAVSALMVNLARQLQLPSDYVTQAGTAGLFMDIGKAFLPPLLLSKRLPYTAEDWAEMHRHPQLGAEAVSSSGDLSKIVADVCLHHHERYDGSGYPHGLAGDDISLFARMAAICDTYDALTSARPHRAAYGPAEAIAEMYKLKGHFDESMLTAFIRSIGVYPVGSLVRLESRRLALVVAQRREQLTRPVVRVFYSVVERAHVPPQELDLSIFPEPDRIVCREEPSRWGLSNWDDFSMNLLHGQPVKHAA
ncbi:HD-GYP domain-containing protein [Sphingosinicella terrae]|jgi:HD-GYP domain-containing protein (c-di-GMP phosphodiesterase class II)|uniref:HD-GYP domain-containing protein n=1 Tax=Sphingosinicella terrae TaxID=2172047 RepID=UPI000E0CE267|nr:HD-GYP domain-containing protein [Sphingosinicella terrae]